MGNPELGVLLVLGATAVLRITQDTTISTTVLLSLTYL
jgi:hypothetical protein